MKILIGGGHCRQSKDGPLAFLQARFKLARLLGALRVEEAAWGTNMRRSHSIQPEPFPVAENDQAPHVFPIRAGPIAKALVASD